MIKPNKKPTVKEISIGGIKRVLHFAGADQDYVNQFVQEVMTTNNLQQTALKYICVERR